MSLKVGDNWTVPLCFEHHEALHLFGSEQTWWATQGIDPVEWAESKWKEYNGEG